jgi:hypothetical protein
LLNSFSEGSINLENECAVKWCILVFATDAGTPKTPRDSDAAEQVLSKAIKVVGDALAGDDSVCDQRLFKREYEKVSEFVRRDLKRTLDELARVGH